MASDVTISKEGIDSRGLKTNLMVNYLPYTLTDREFMTLFSNIGPLESFNVARDRNTGSSYGYGFVNYMSPADAVTAISNLHGHKIFSRTLRVAYAKGKSANPITKAPLYISGLTPSTDEKALKDLFGSYGELVYARILRNPDGSSRSAGFVLFKEKDKAEKAILELQGHTDNNGMKLNIKYQRELSAQQNKGIGGKGMGNDDMGSNHMNNNFEGLKAMRGRDISSHYNPITQPQYGSGAGPGMSMGGKGMGVGPSPMGNDPNPTNLSSSLGHDPAGEGIGSQGLKTKLIVNYLPESLTDGEFNALFRSIGPFGLEGATVVRRNNFYSYNDSNISCGYGFVDYANPEDAATAISQLNGYNILGKTIKVHYTKPNRASKNANRGVPSSMGNDANPTNHSSSLGHDPSEEGIGSKGLKTKLFVNYVPYSLTDADFTALFGSIGSLEGANVLRNEMSARCGYGFVDYVNPEDAATAISQLNGYKILGRLLDVQYTKPNRASKNFNRGGPSSMVNDLNPTNHSNSLGHDQADEGIGSKGLKTKLIVNYLPESLTDREFNALFRSIGSLEGANVVRNENSDSFGYGFVDYTNPEDAATAISRLNGYKILGKTLKVGYSKPNRASKNTNLYISGLSSSTDEKALKKLFESYGEIVYTRILRNPDGSSKSEGLVMFKDKRKAEAAIRDLQGKIFNDDGQALDIKYHHEILTQKFMQQNKGMGDMGEGHDSMGVFHHLNTEPMHQDFYGAGSGGNPMNHNLVGQKATRARARYNPIARPQFA